jgi:hypothetical protein
VVLQSLVPHHLVARQRRVRREPHHDAVHVLQVLPRRRGRREVELTGAERQGPGRGLVEHAAAFEHLDDPYAFARAVADAGYATAPNYYEILAVRMRELAASQ